MAKDQIGLAIRIVMGRAEGTTAEGAQALRLLIRTANQRLANIEAVLASKIEIKARVASPYLVAKREQHAKAAITALSLYETVKVLGRSIGDIWYHELDAIRGESAFAASLADQIIRCGIPNRPTRVRDFINRKTLAEMVKKASAKTNVRVAA